MPCEHNFGIIENLDTKKDYADFDEFIAFPEVFPAALKAYKCVNIDDDALNDWWPRIESMKSFFHTYSRPETSLARWGVTLIPPESLDLFYDIVAKETKEEFIDQMLCVLDIISQAKRENKYVIHFGV